jgi:hypothetical protein
MCHTLFSQPKGGLKKNEKFHLKEMFFLTKISVEKGNIIVSMSLS